jgi:carboxymethylenebutenolidase
MTSMTMIEIPAGDDICEAWLAEPAGATSPRPGVLLFGDAFGLRPRVHEMADRIASWGYVVLAPNLFYRDGRVADIAPKEDLRQPGARETFFSMARPRIDALTTDRTLTDIALFLDALRTQEQVADGPVGVTGYCMGARYAVRAACAHPDVVTAAGGFHGGGLVTDAPDSPHRGLASARAEFVFGHADNDRSMTGDNVAALGAALADAGLVASNEVYEGAPHGYSMSDTSAYDENAAERHFGALQKLLSSRL